MVKIEKNIVSYLYKKMPYIAIGMAIVFSLVLRYMCRGFLSGDMEVFLLPWMESLQKVGLARTIHLPACNYHVAYLLLLSLAGKLPVTNIVAVKMISIVFDYLAAGATVWLVWEIKGKQVGGTFYRALVPGVIMLLLPTVFANSSLWGQCDVIYTFFTLMCLVFIVRKQYPLAFLMLSLAICFKLQAIFILPLMIFLYFMYCNFSILNFLQIPALLFLSGLPARLPGDSLFYGFELYLGQAGTYQALYKDYPNVWFIFSKFDFDIFAPIGIVATATVFVLAMALFAYKKWIPSFEEMILLGAFCIFTCGHFLPAMHERYAFAGEWLLCLYFLLRPTLRRFLLFAGIYWISLLMYIRVFAERGFITQEQMALFNLFGYLFLCIALVRRATSKKEAAHIEPRNVS